jgi:hypothetical protein
MIDRTELRGTLVSRAELFSIPLPKQLQRHSFLGQGLANGRTVRRRKTFSVAAVRGRVEKCLKLFFIKIGRQKLA